MLWVGGFYRDAASIVNILVESCPANQGADSRQVPVKCHCYFKLLKFLDSMIKGLLKCEVFLVSIIQTQQQLLLFIHVM